MDKVIVEVYVPVIDNTFDMFLPLQSPMSEVLELMKRAVIEMSDGRFQADENTILCRREDGTILNINLSVYELGIQNGTKLMLV